MANDYRNTKYCPSLGDVGHKKKKVEVLIRKDHPKAIDMHAYISKNDEFYKKNFMEAYNYKCAYCGVSIDLIPKSVYEIDHYIYEKSSKFVSKKDAGYIENLVLSCHDCNHKKSSFLIPDGDFQRLYPDNEEITNTFYRDDLYYIQISDDEKDNQTVINFYKQLQLGAEVHRLDYLLMSMIGLQRKHIDDEKLYLGIGKIIDILRKKRNL